MASLPKCCSHTGGGGFVFVSVSPRAEAAALVGDDDAAWESMMT